MDRINELYKKLSSFNVDKIIDSTTKSIESMLIDANTHEQLYLHGKLSNGESLPPYTLKSKWLKSAGGGDKRIQNMTLKDEGDFYKGWKIKYQKDQFTFYSTDSKTGELVKRYGEEIFGLTTANLQEFIDKDYRPEIQNEALKLFT